MQERAEKVQALNRNMSGFQFEHHRIIGRFHADQHLGPTNGISRASTRRNRSGAIFDPQPPHRGPLTPKPGALVETGSGVEPPPAGEEGSDARPRVRSSFAPELVPVLSRVGPASGSGRSWYWRIQRQSIQSFQRQTQRPSQENRPHEATAHLFPLLIGLRKCRWGE